MQRPGNLGGAFGRRRWRWRWRKEEAAAGKMRHGQGSRSNSGIELAFEGVEFEGIVEGASAVPDGGGLRGGF